MTHTLAITLNSMNPPALSESDASAIKSFQRDWERHTERMSQLDLERIPKDRKDAYDAFLADPTEQNEQRLAVLADERLTARRHSLLHQAHAELRRQANEKAAAILEPSLMRIQQALTRELEGRQQTLKAEGLNQWNDDRCIELRRTIDQVALGLRAVAEAAVSAKGAEKSPLELAALLPEASVDLPHEKPEMAESPQPEEL